MKLLWTFLLFTGLITFSNGANILFYFGVSTYSHRITAWPLVEALVENGHKVTFLQSATNKNPNPKVEELVLHQPDDLAIPLDFLNLRLKYGKMLMPVLITMLPELGVMACNQTLNDPVVMKWINSNKVDLVIIDALFNDCAFGLAHKWKASTAIFATSAVFEWMPDDHGFPQENNWIPNLHFGQDLPMTFFGKVFATLMSLYMRFVRVEVLYPRLEKMLIEGLKMPDMPPLQELNANTSLILLNTHFSEEVARSLPPMVIPVGGMHCTNKLQPLPKDMADFINGSKEGFIFVSFGSEVRLRDTPNLQNIRNAFFKAFKNSKIRFIWKWEGERPKDMPSNVFTAKWVPQQTILADKKIRGFITHGGLLSIQEVLHYPVPMITFPVFAEQDYNAERIHRMKRGIRLDITTVTQAELEDAINKILTDDTYMKNVKKASVLFQDRPQKPLDTAVWWVEYILRHKDEPHILRPMAVSQTWYQKRSLDVWAFILTVILSSFLMSIWIFKKLIACCFCRSKSENKTKTKVKKH